MKNPLKLYLADDDQDDRLLFGEALAELSIPVTLTVFNDGEALLKAMEAGPEVMPDLVFLDMNMPRKNGLECLEIIKSDQVSSEIPVVIFSTAVDEHLARSVAERGAAGVIQKPSNYAELKKTLQDTLADHPVR